MNKTLRPADCNHTGGDLGRISHVDNPNLSRRTPRVTSGDLGRTGGGDTARVFFVREEAEGLFTAGGVNRRRSQPHARVT